MVARRIRACRGGRRQQLRLADRECRARRGGRPRLGPPQHPATLMTQLFRVRLRIMMRMDPLRKILKGLVLFIDSGPTSSLVWKLCHRCGCRGRSGQLMGKRRAVRCPVLSIAGIGSRSLMIYQISLHPRLRPSQRLDHRHSRREIFVACTARPPDRRTIPSQLSPNTPSGKVAILVPSFDLLRLDVIVQESHQRSVVIIFFWIKFQIGGGYGCCVILSRGALLFWRGART